MSACFAIAFSPMTCSYNSSWKVVTKQSKCYRTLSYRPNSYVASDLGRVRGEEVAFLGAVQDLRAHKPGLMDETEMSKGASSSRSAALMASTANLVPEYAWVETSCL